MIRSCNHSFYPRVAESPLDQQVRVVLNASERGKATPADVAAAQDEVSSILVADQSRAFIDVVTDGMVRWDGPMSHLATHFDGFEMCGLRRWFDTNFYERRVAVVGEISRPEPFLVRDYKIAEDVAQTPVKTALPGPVTFARLAIDEHYGGLDALADALAEAIAVEVRDLAAAGATYFQLDEPMLCRHPEDLDLVARTAARVFEAAGTGATTILSTHYGDLNALAGRLDRLPGTHLGLDVVAAPGNLDLIAGLPEDRGVVLGLFDARTTVQEDAAEVAEVLTPHRETLTSRDVMVGPNAGLALLPRDQAFDKLLHARYVVEKLSREWTWAS